MVWPLMTVIVVIYNLVVFVVQNIHHEIFHLILHQLSFEPMPGLVYMMHTVKQKKIIDN